MLPFIIRLSGQLLIQVIKHRSTINTGVTDSEELVPYYEHYRLFFLLLLSIICFIVFNLIKAFYLLKALFLYVVEPISLNIVLNLWSGFQDVIISFGLISILQITYFLQGKKFKFGRFLCLIILRFVWVLSLESGLLVNLISFYFPSYQSLDQLISFSITQFDTTTRFIFIFRIAKEAYDLVKKKIDLVLNDFDVRRVMGHERAEKMYRASIVFRFLAWGNFALASLTFLTSTLQFILSITLFFINTILVVHIFFNVTILLVELIYLLTSVLYFLFFLLLWRLYKSPKPLYSGYSHFDQSFNYGLVEETVPINYQTLTLVGSKMQKYLLRFYTVSVSIITIIFISFITPLLFTGWKSAISLTPGDYYQFDKSNLHKAMQICSENIITFPQGSELCKDFSFATVLPNTTFEYQSVPMYIHVVEEAISGQEDNVSGHLWIPSNSTLHEFEDISAVNLSMVLESNIPCPDVEKNNYDHVYHSSINFDCLLNKANFFFHNTSCWNQTSCGILQKKFISGGMLWLSLTSHSTFPLKIPKFYIQRPIYNFSTLSNIVNVDKFKDKSFNFSHNIIIDVAKSEIFQFPKFKECVIMFTCRFNFYYSLAIGLLILISFPVYLMVGIIAIHRF